MHSGYDFNKGEEMSRRSFLRLAGYGGVGLLTAGYALGVREATAGDLNPAKVSRMEFDVSYKTQIHNLPSDAERVRIWLPLPPSDYAQDVLDLEVLSSLPYKTMTEKMYGNKLVHVETGRQSDSFSVEARYHVVRRRVGAEKAKLDAESAKKYRRLTQRVRVTDEVGKFAEQAVGKSTQPVEVGRKVFDAIIDLLVYDKKIKGCGTGDTEWIMKHKRGKCDDYHALFMAMMISRGVPIRWEQGFPLPYPSSTEVVSGGLEGDCSGAHCWVSFFDDEHGWIPIDVSEADKHPEMRGFFFGHLTPNRFKISEGRAITLEPGQGGDALSTFAFAYAEADGVPLIYQSNYENKINYTITKVEIA
ncbi:MAG: transglutaminase-like domain-containing protein [Candidatus Binatia bacterium]